MSKMLWCSSLYYITVALHVACSLNPCIGCAGAGIFNTTMFTLVVHCCQSFFQDCWLWALAGARPLCRPRLLTEMQKCSQYNSQFTIGLDVDKPGSAFDSETSTLSMCSNALFVFLFQSLNLQSSDCCSLTSIQQSSVTKLLKQNVLESILPESRFYYSWV